MRLFLVLMFFAGLVLVFANEFVKRPPDNRVEYRYLPRDVDAQMRDEKFSVIDRAGIFDADDLALEKKK